MNIYQIIIECENLKLGKGYYITFQVIAENLTNAENLALMESNKDGYIAKVDESELLKKDQNSIKEMIIDRTGRAYFDC